MHQEPSQQASTGSFRTGGRWSQERRLEFIDYRLRWDGRLNRSDLIDFFGISIPQASLDIARYSELAPANIRYDRSGRVYLAGEDFEPVYAVGSSQRFLGDVLAQAAGLSSLDSSFLGWAPPVGVAPVPSRVIPSRDASHDSSCDSSGPNSACRLPVHDQSRAKGARAVTPCAWA